jgi:hypothetical protein
MEFKVFGHPIRVVNVIVFILIGILICTNLICSCCNLSLRQMLGLAKEGMETMDHMAKANKKEEKKKGKHTNAPHAAESDKEGYSNMKDDAALVNASDLGHDNNEDVKKSWISNAMHYAGNMGYKTFLQKAAENKGTPVPLEGTMDFFKDNAFRPDCCPSTYSLSTGCACLSSDQLEYLNERGGNRTFPTEF